MVVLNRIFILKKELDIFKEAESLSSLSEGFVRKERIQRSMDERSNIDDITFDQVN